MHVRTFRGLPLGRILSSLAAEQEKASDAVIVLEKRRRRLLLKSASEAALAQLDREIQSLNRQLDQMCAVEQDLNRQADRIGGPRRDEIIVEIMGGSAAC
jgi:hypothetical protein